MRYCRWWLRSPGNNQNNATNVNSAGSPGNNNVNNDNNCVRPAFPDCQKLTLRREARARGGKEYRPLSQIFADKYTDGAMDAGWLSELRGVRRYHRAPPKRFKGKTMQNILFDYTKIYDFQNLYKAYLQSRRSKRAVGEVIQFELNAGAGLAELQKELEEERYRISGYYHFTIHDPKVREIYALHYRDRIVQHSLCDNLIAPYMEAHLIYDNAACRKGKGTLFAMNRLNKFLHQHYRAYGRNGYFLKCDIRKFFDHIDHDILKTRMAHIVDDDRTLRLLYHIIDSYETATGKGIPMGNQTSQWFALYYLDPLDRLIKEKLRVKHYTRYMDDMVLISPDKEELKTALTQMQEMVSELKLEFNQKTQIFPIASGVEYLGWRYTLSETGAVIRRLKRHSKIRWQHRLRKLQEEYEKGEIESGKIRESLQSYRNHMSYGNTWKLYSKVMSGREWKRGEED